MRSTKVIDQLLRAPVRAAVIAIVFYQRTISRDTGSISRGLGYAKRTCVFYPTCSEYTKEALLKYGFFKGSFLSIRRILRCHPWQENHMDPIP